MTFRHVEQIAYEKWLAEKCPSGDVESVQSQWLESSEYADLPPECGCCDGSGLMVRDPDIGTDQECFVCDGSGVIEESEQDTLDFPQLPTWAVKISDGNYMEPGAQLATRDGRRTGNAYVDCIVEHPELGKLAVVITDIGNLFRMTLSELQEAFHQPSFVMDVAEARRSRGVKLSQEQENGI